jgi:hypothetical protein
MVRQLNSVLSYSETVRRTSWSNTCPSTKSSKYKPAIVLPSPVTDANVADAKKVAGL